MLTVGLLALQIFARGPDAEFTPLFNGKNLEGWAVPVGDNGHWKVEAGCIDCDASSEAEGDKNLWTEREYGDFVLRVDWRIKATPFINRYVPYVLPDGTHARDGRGQPLTLSISDSDSGILFRGGGINQVNIWCWPIGSGELYGYRTDEARAPEVRAAVTPRTQADRPVGEWNSFEITVRGDRVTVVLNGILVIDRARLPGLPAKGRIGLQHHGAMKDGRWTSSPSLVQFRNIAIKELPAAAGSGEH